MADRLRVTELDFDTIKTNLKTFLNQQSQFTDYDFEGSGLNVLLDILAYNTHYNAYYLNMVANESFMDSALLRDSVVSHAKVLNYTPSSASAPKAVINFTVTAIANTAASITIPAGYTFLSELIDGKAHSFVVLENQTVTKSNTTFNFENLDIYEGQLVTYNYTYNAASNPKQIFTLPDSGIDTSTIKVTVAASASNTATSTYNSVTDILDVGSTSEVYYLQEHRSGKYQIYFGNDVVGKSLPDGALVSVTYLVTNGSVANKANNFIALNTLTDSIGQVQNLLTVQSITAAAGGAPRESVDNIKFSAASQFATQNRLVTTKDYESYIQNKYPVVDSISVWGGEENVPPVYGKVFVSIKPKTDYYISEAEKTRIASEIIAPKAILGISSQILDPDYLYLIVSSTVQYDKNKTNNTEETIRTNIRNAVLNYRNINLNKFGAKFILSKMQESIDATDFNAILGSETTVRVQKRFEPTLNTFATYNIYFNVPLHRGTITNKLTSTEFVVADTSGTDRTVSFDETPQSFSGLSSILVTNPGTGYTTTPTVTITGDGTGATAKAIVVNGSIQSIAITNRGIDYTRAIVTISGGNGYGAAATAEIDARQGTIRTVYYDSNAQRQIVNENAGVINYDTGIITITNINIKSIVSTDGLIRLSVESEKGIIQSVRNTIITIDETDPSSIVTTLQSS
jgi:hypothetical protein